MADEDAHRDGPDRPPSGGGHVESGWRSACTIGTVGAVVSLLFSLATIVAVVTLGGPPETAAETFTLLQEDRFAALVRLELLSLINVGAYYLTFFGLYAALKRANPALATLATALAYAGVTLWISSHSLNALLTLSDRYAAAATEAQRSHLLAAGEALMAADMWHSTAALVGGLLLEVGAVLICLVMLRSAVFSKAIAWIGLVAHGLDLTQILLSLFVPGVAPYVMAVAGPLYLVWFALLARRLYQLGRPASV